MSIRVKVTSCGEPTVEKLEGKNCSSYEFLCDGFIGGKPASGFIVKTLSGKASKWVQPGFEFDADEDHFQGQTKYKIPTWMYKKDTPMPAGAQRPVIAGEVSAPPSEQPAQQTASTGADGHGSRRGYRRDGDVPYTLEEYDAIVIHAVQLFKGLLCPPQTGDAASTIALPSDNDALSKLVATYLISGIPLGIKVNSTAATGPTDPPFVPGDAYEGPESPALTPPDEGEQPSSELHAIDTILSTYPGGQARKLAWYVKDKGIGRDVLLQWWDDCGQSKSMFISRVSAELEK